ncbi:AraC family transcriptional regulator [Candidatus Enterococcus ferrettii]|uniref:AraC family transcriptional regulator n=1 Tax=Candidatus Enterococcus ferrettii TaxID=2815324 RepID=A0ABV0EJJ1_9ENTE|nr:AraC family transcriptional regulator [Enterococcus sp. 665A]MBO1338490.1 AraC family transcriptional regulator [Enterococcus sp. 665A]
MLKNLNQLIEYIEDRLTEEFSVSAAAKAIGISEYHLKRTFSFIAGMTLFEYIKNRKLALANRDLIFGEKVTEVAFKYGYQTVEGFSRAFREWSGYSPSEVSKNNIQKSFPKLSFFIDVKGGSSMKFKIEEKAAFRLIGVSQRVPYQFEGENQAIRQLTESLTPQQKANMHKLGDLYPHQVLNASYNFDQERSREVGELTYMIGCATTKENPFEDLEEILIPSHTWAIFPIEGIFPNTLQETWKKIYMEWLPSSDYELVEAPEISFIRFGDDSKMAYSEIWLAVKQK